MFKKIRILILLYILLMVAVATWLSRARTTDWDFPLAITIYPINGDQSPVTSKYIASLDNETFSSIEAFFEREAGRYQLALKSPVDIDLAPKLNAHPPEPPYGKSVLSVMYWSLKMRYWAWQNDNYDYPEDIQVFILYFDPDKHKQLTHSLGLQKGLIGVVHAFASEKMSGENNVIIAHEILHTLGATDKYDVRTNYPYHPIGFAEPDKIPPIPQKQAEIMAGRIPVSKRKAEIPENLQQTVVGKATAFEIRWIHEYQVP